MKKLFLSTLTAIFLLTLCACGSNTSYVPPSKAPDTPVKTQTTPVKTQATPTQTAAAKTTPTPEETYIPQYEPVHAWDCFGATKAELVQYLGQPAGGEFQEIGYVFDMGEASCAFGTFDESFDTVPDNAKCIALFCDLPFLVDIADSYISAEDLGETLDVTFGEPVMDDNTGAYHVSGGNNFMHYVIACDENGIIAKYAEVYIREP